MNDIIRAAGDSIGFGIVCASNIGRELILIFAGCVCATGSQRAGGFKLCVQDQRLWLGQGRGRAGAVSHLAWLPVGGGLHNINIIKLCSLACLIAIKLHRANKHTNAHTQNNTFCYYDFFCFHYRANKHTNVHTQNNTFCYYDFFCFHYCFYYCYHFVVLLLLLRLLLLLLLLR